MNNVFMRFYRPLVKKIDDNMEELDYRLKGFRSYFNFPQPINEELPMIMEHDKIERRLSRFRTTRDLLTKIFGETSTWKLNY